MDSKLEFGSPWSQASVIRKSPNESQNPKNIIFSSAGILKNYLPAPDLESGKIISRNWRRRQLQNFCQIRGWNQNSIQNFVRAKFWFRLRPFNLSLAFPVPTCQPSTPIHPILWKWPKPEKKKKNTFSTANLSPLLESKSNSNFLPESKSRKEKKN